MYLQHLVFVTPLLLSAAIVEELELVYKMVKSYRRFSRHCNIVLCR